MGSSVFTVKLRSVAVVINRFKSYLARHSGGFTRTTITRTDNCITLSNFSTSGTVSIFMTMPLVPSTTPHHKNNF